MGLRTLALAYCFFFGGLSSSAFGWTAEKQDQQVFQFKKGSGEGSNTTAPIPYKAPFPDPEWIAFLGEKTPSPPFVLMKGRTCQNCSPDQKTYYLTNIKPNSKLYSMIYPGKIVDPKKGMVYESRAFYGQCLASGKEGYFVFQREYVNKRRGFQKSVYSAVLNGAGNGTELTENLQDGRRNLPRIETAIHSVKLKNCFELPAQNRKVLRTAFDLGPSRVGLKEDEEDKEPEKEEEKKSPDALAEDAARAPSAARLVK